VERAGIVPWMFASFQIAIAVVVPPMRTCVFAPL
jgi:hypothetical protein